MPSRNILLSYNGGEHPLQPLGRFPTTLISCIGTQSQTGDSPIRFSPPPAVWPAPHPRSSLSAPVGRPTGWGWGLGNSYPLATALGPSLRGYCRLARLRLPTGLRAPPTHHTPGPLLTSPSGPSRRTGRYNLPQEAKPNLLHTPAALASPLLMTPLEFWVAFCDGLQRRARQLNPPMHPR